jgi:diguanylate cyclase (GGDEF)-like protein/PAS domain S-box-containing protein
MWVLVGDAWIATLFPDAAAREQAHLWKGAVAVALVVALSLWVLRRIRMAERARGVIEQELQQVASHAPAGIARVALGSGGELLWANERLCAWLGMPLASFKGQRFSSLVQPADREWTAKQLERLLAGDIDYYEGPRLCKGPGHGPGVPVLCTVSHVPAVEGVPAHLVCLLQDMSEIEAARAALQHSETRLRLALDGSGSGMWDWDMESSQFTFSQGMVRLLRYEGRELPSNTRLLRLLHPEDRFQVRRSVVRAIAKGSSFHERARLQCFDGQYRWFEARGQSHLDVRGLPERFSGILTDLSDELQAEERQRLAATVVDNTIEGVVVTDAKSRILSVNAAFTRLMGYTEDELYGLTPRVFKSGRHDRSFYDAMWSRMRRTGHWQGEVWNRRKNGEVFPERMSLSAVKDADGDITHYVCMFTDISEEKAQRQRLEFLAHNDSLTGLLNRNAFGQQLDEAVREARASGEKMAVLLLNIDRLKDVNDSYGHAVGDQVLKHVAYMARSVTRPGDTLGRMAGDELAVLVRQVGDADGAEEVASRLIAAVGEPWRSPEGLAVVTGASVGICLFPEHAQTAQALQQGAHAAVYDAKGRGRGIWSFFHEDMTQAARERLAMEARLRQALVDGHFLLYYQPQVDIATGRIVGAEALVRWLDPEEGLISPARFIPVAEMTGVIGPLGEWVMREACRQGQAWRAQGLPNISVAVNLSPRQFHLTDVAGCAASALADSQFPPHLLELELTETALAERPEEARQVLLRLQALGVRMAVDDFGTGYSSLAHLKRFPIDVLKIDQGFIRDIPRSSDDMAISAAIIAMGHSLGLQVLAEGVETPEQLEFLRGRGCNSYQGYLCSRPLPAQEFTALLAEELELA